MPVTGVLGGGGRYLGSIYAKAFYMPLLSTAARLLDIECKTFPPKMCREQPHLRARCLRYVRRGRKTYPSVDNAIAAFNSAAYQEALKVLGDAAVRDVRVVEGLD